MGMSLLCSQDILGERGVSGNSKGVLVRLYLPSPYIELINKAQAEQNLNETTLWTKRKVISTLGMRRAKWPLSEILKLSTLLQHIPTLLPTNETD